MYRACTYKHHFCDYRGTGDSRCTLLPHCQQPIYCPWTQTVTDDWDGKFKARVTWKVKKFTDALCRINFSFVWMRHQQQYSPRCIYKYKWVHELLWGVGIFSPTWTLCFWQLVSRVGKMFVLVLVVLLYHEAWENTVKWSEPRSLHM